MEYSFQHPTAMLLALIPALFNIGILIYGLLRLPKNRLTSLFLLLVFCILCWQCNDVMMRISANEIGARFWDKFFSLGIFAVAPLSLHFAAEYSGAKFLRSRLGLFLIYAPFVIFNTFYLALQSHQLFYNDPYWGYINIPRPNSLETVQFIVVPLVIIIAVAVLIRFSYKMWHNKEMKWPSLIIGVGLLIPTLQGLVTQVIFYLFFDDRQIPLASTTVTVFSLAVVVALSRFRLFTISDFLGLDIILKSMSDIVVIADSHGTVRYANPYTAETLKLPGNYSGNWEIKNLFSGNEDKFLEFKTGVLDTCLKGISVRNFETAFYLAPNNIAEVLVNAEPILDDGESTGVLFIARDITERKKILWRLRTENQVFERLSSGLTGQEVLRQYFDDARLESGNKDVYVLYEADKTGRNLTPILASFLEDKQGELFADLSAEENTAVVQKALKSGGYYGLDPAQSNSPLQLFLQTEKIDGISAHHIHASSGQLLGVLAIFLKDQSRLEKENWAVQRMLHITELIMERARISGDMEIQQRVYTDLVNTIDGIVYEYNLENRSYEFVSNRAQELLGYPLEKWYTEKDFQMNHAHPDDKWVLDDMPNKFFPENSVEFEYRMISKSGEIIWVKDYLRVVYQNNIPVRLKGIVLDITQAKNTELEREKAAADLIRRNRDLEQFTYIVSHNLRAPLANILGCSAALNLIQNEEDRAELMQGIAQSAQNLDGVVQDLNSILSLQKVASEKIERIHLEELITDVVESLKSQWKGEFNIHLELEQIPYINSVRPYLYSIVHNLISNSYKYRHPSRTGELRISSTRLDKMVQLTFKDNGIGIDMETNKHNVFGMYKRFHTDVEGKGLGLFMVKSQAEALQGNVEVYSEPNEGAEFRIYLPQ